MSEESSVVALPLVAIPAIPDDMQRHIARRLAERQQVHAATLHAMLRDQGAALARAADLLVGALRRGRKVLAAGNGGSAAEAQHFVAELVGRFKMERLPFAAISLTGDVATLSAIANDYGFADAFARQIGGLGQPGDIFVAFSTSGASENLIRAAEICRQQQLPVIAVVSARTGRLAGLADIAIRIPSRETEIIQEMHMVVTHLLCEIVEMALAERGVFTRGD